MIITKEDNGDFNMFCQVKADRDFLILFKKMTDVIEKFKLDCVKAKIYNIKDGEFKNYEYKKIR